MTREFIRYLGVVLLGCVFTLLSSCSADPLTKEVERAVSDPTARNAETFRRIEQIILASPDKYAMLIGPDGKIIPAKLQETINRIGRTSDPAFVWDISAYGSGLRGPLRLTLMLERSGSMTGYDIRLGSGNFKRTLNELLNRFPTSGGEPRIMIVNDGVYPFNGSIGSFMRDKDIFASTVGIGDPSYTDFGRIFDVFLNDTTAENVYVLATDLIYSPRDAEGLTPDKIFNESGSLVSDIFRRHKDKEVAVVRLVTDYRGRYYPYTSPREGVEYSGGRPFFLLIAGSRAAMAELFGGQDYASFADFSTLPGYTGHYRMNREAVEPPYYTVLPRRRDSEGRYSPSGASENDGAAHALYKAEPGKDGRLEFEIAADLRRAPVDTSYLCNTVNYDIMGAGSPRLLSVRPISSDDINVRNKRYLGRASHILTVEADVASIGSEVSIRLLNRVPEWVNKRSSSSDVDISAPSFGSTTFGLSHLIEGIYRAMYGTAQIPAYITMNIDIKK